MADDNKKNLIIRLLKQIFEKSQETLGIQNLGKFIKNNYYKGDNQKEKEESLVNLSKIIISEMLDTQFKKYIIHGDMSIFYSLFCIFKSIGANNEQNLIMGLLDPLFDFFQKKDAKVVCNSVNIAIKIIRGNKYFILKNFNKIFKNLIILILRKEIEIRNCGFFLDEIMKNDIGAIFQDRLNSENDEEVKLIMENLIKMLGENNCPAKNILIVSWLDFFENIPQITTTNLTNNYIQIIPKLFKMLCSNVKEEISSSEFCLKKIIDNIDILYEDLINKDSEIIYKILEIIINICDSKVNEQIQKCSFELLEVILKKFKKIVMEYNDLGEKLDIIDEKNIASPFSKNMDSSYNIDSFEEHNNEDENKNDKELDFKNNKNKAFKINNKYIDEVTNKDQEKIKFLMDNIPLKLFPDILSFIIHHSINNSNNPIIYEYINKCNTTFKKLITMIKSEYFKKKNGQKLAECFKEEINLYINFHDYQMNEISINLIFDWILQLYKIHIYNDEEYLKHLFFVVPEINELIIKRILGILNEISSKNCDIIEIIIKKFIECPQMINSYGILILKELLKTFNVKILFENITNILLNKNINDFNFIMRMIYLLNKFLIVE